MRLRGNANTIVGLGLLLVGAVALLAGMDTPATSAERIVIRTEDGRTLRDVDREELERFAEEMSHWSEQFGEDMARMLEDLDLEIALDIDPHGDSSAWIGRRDDDGVRVHFDADEFARHMEAMARDIERAVGQIDERDIERKVERMARRIERQVERAVREVERDGEWRSDDRYDRWDRRDDREDRGDDRHGWRDSNRDRDDESLEIRREIEALERQIERLQRRLERLDDEGR